MATKSVFQKVVILTVIASFVVWNMAAVAAPEGSQVAAGGATISQSGTNTTVTQSTQNTVINWHGFNTTANETVNFVQPNASSIALNRITSGLPTSYAGQLTANGQVWILNPAGVLFTSTSKIDVGGLVATTLGMKDSDFMNKNYALSPVPGFSQGSVINSGFITAHQNGLVALVAPTVENNGTITANMGNVLLASGTVATIDPYGDNLINFAPNNYAVEGSVTNRGTITANGGKVVMAANSVNKIIKDVVNNGGFIEATNAIQSSNGVIILGGGSGTTNIGGTIHSNRIVIKGHDTVISGSLTTPAGGNIETSGEMVTISPDAVINAGQGGLWYLDPLSIDIATQYGNVIQNQLQAGTSVILSTGVTGVGGGDIVADQAITWNTPASLTLMAYSTIFVTAPITATNGSSAIILHADTGRVGGPVVFSGAGSVNTNGVAIIYYHPLGGYGAPTNFAPFFPTNQPTAFMTINDLGNLQSVGVNPNANYLLNNDIDVGIGSGVLPSGVFTQFTGIFDGHDYLTGGTHSITNLDVSATIAGHPYRGGIAAENYGTIENVNVTGQITDINSGNSSGVGGIAGYNEGTINFVTFTSVGPNNLWADNGPAYVGGIVGINVNGTIERSGSYGTLTYGNNSGGIAGEMANGTISNDYSQMSVAGNNRGGIIGTALGIITFQYVYYAGNSSGMDAFIGNGASALTGVPGGVFYVYGSDHCTACTVGYLTLHGIPAGGFPDSSLKDAFTMNSLSGFTFNAGPGTWTTQGGAQLPTIIQNNSASNFVLLSGSLSSAAVQTVSLYGGNNFLGNFSTTASGDFGFEYNPDTGAYGFYLATTNGGTVKGTILKTVPNDVPVTNLNITNNLVKVDGGSGFTNANLAVATSNAPYTVSGNNLTLSSGVSFLTTAITPYTLNGNITTSGAGTIIFNNTVSLTTDSVLTSAGLIDFASTVNGGHNLTANGSDVIFGGTVGATPLTSLTVSTGNAFVLNSAIHSSGVVKISSLGNITLNNSIFSTDNAGIHSIILSGNNLINNVGSGVLVMGANDSFAIYLSNPSGSTFGGLVSGNQAIWNKTILSLPPVSVPSGDHYIFSFQPSVTMTTTGAVKTYGTDLTGSVGGFYNPITGFVDANLYGNVFTQDTVSNALTGVSASSSGAAPTANVAGSPHAVTGAATAATGYNVIFNNAGQIIVNAAPLTITANNQSKTYGQTFTFTGTEFTSSPLQNSETIGSATMTSAATSATADATNPPVAGGVAPYAINILNATGGTFNPANYAITYDAGSFTVNPATLNISSTSQIKTYGTTLLPATTFFNATGLQNGEVIGTVNITSGGLVPTASVLGGPYAITGVSGATGGTFNANNYTINYTAAGNITVNPAPLTITSLSQAKLFGFTLPVNTTFFSSSVLQNGETISTVDIASAGLAPSASVAGSPYPITSVSNAVGTLNPTNYAITYNPQGAITVSTSVLTITSKLIVKYLGSALSGTTTFFTLSGILVPGQGVDTVDIVSAGLAASAPIGGYPITSVSNAAGLGFDPLNYVIVYVPALDVVVLPENFPAAITTPQFDRSQFNYCALSGCDHLTIDSSRLILGPVAVADGAVEAIDQNGSIRLLADGDTVFVGETVITGPDSHICILVPGVGQKCLGPNEKYKV